MSLFYTNLATTRNVRQSFTDAQHTLRQKYPLPFFWGAFLLTGN